MGFLSTPSEVIGNILQAVAFSGSNGVSTEDLWSICADKLNQNSIDLFTKQIVWKWLFFNPQVTGALFIWKDGSSIIPDIDYQQFSESQINEESLRIYPSQETQWRFLTGTEFSKKLKSQLGDYPFQLLCEIAKHGKNGAFASDLGKLTGQDPRSLTTRLKKLEEMKFISRVSAYNSASNQHTSLCKHVSFIEQDTDLASLEFSDNLNYSRDATKLRDIIFQKLKQAPGGLRGLNDLKHELKLGVNRSTAKFFRGVVESLCKKGYLEKVMVKSTSPQVKAEPTEITEMSDLSADTTTMVYCIKLIKDVTNATDQIDIDEMFEAIDELEDSENQTKIPSINDFFPITTQIYDHISKSSGPNSMELVLKMSGAPDYRPYTKLLDSISTLEEKKSNSKLKVPYEGISITRNYDFEGKFKFYRYFTTKSDKIIDNSPIKQTNKTLQSLNKRLNSSIGKFKEDTLFSNKRKLGDVVGHSRSRPASAPVKRQKTFAKSESPMSEDKMVIEPPQDFVEKKRASTNKLNFSLKSSKRQAALLELIKESGGVIFTSANLLRSLDTKLGSKTSTDMKTLVRDIAVLVHTRIVESRDIQTVRSGQNITRRLLILLDPESRPSELEIEAVIKACEADDGRKFHPSVIERRVIEADVTLVSSPTLTKRRLGTLTTSQRTRRPRSNSTKDGLKSINKEVSDDSKEEVAANPLSTYVGSRFKGRRAITRKELKGDNDNESGGSTTRKRSITLTNKDTSNLFKLVVISRAFRKLIDFNHLSTLFPQLQSLDLKQRWTATRKKIGGQVVVLRAIERFEVMVKKSIEQGKVKLEHLQEPIDFEFFLKLWEKSGSFRLGDILNSLAYNLADNYGNYDVIDSKNTSMVLFDQLENNSMKQKEQISANHPFYQRSDLAGGNADKNVDEIQTFVRAVCLTDQQNFNASAIANILTEYQEDDIQNVLKKMIRDREIIYNGQGDKMFALTDRFDSSLVSLSSVPHLLKEASKFSEVCMSLFPDKKAILLSQGVNSSHMMSLLNSVSLFEMSLVHVNKPYKFYGYESRLIDKAKLDCGIIVKQGEEIESQKFDLQKVHVPTGRACSRVWLDLDGNINSDLWVRIVVSVIYYILFRPGIVELDLFDKFRPVLSYDETKQVLQWLEDSQCLTRGDHNDLWIRNRWYSIVG